MHVKMIYIGSNILVIDEDTTIFTCHLSYMPNTFICLGPMFSHVYSPVVGTKWMSI
jgi:hypothetical protein